MMQPKISDFDTDTISSDLVKFFYDLASQGRGDGARGRYFYMLHILEYAYSEKIESYQPSKAIDQWLVLLFDVVSNYHQPYTNTSEQNYHSIQKALEQKFTSFIEQLRQMGWRHIASITKTFTRRYIIDNDENLRYIPEEQAHYFIGNMSMATIFSKYMQRWRTSSSSEGKHPIAISRLKNIRNKFSPCYGQVIASYHQAKQAKNQALTMVDIIAMLPFSGIRVVTQVVSILEKHENLLPDSYSFATFYALASNASASKEHARHKYKPRIWRAPQDYLPVDDNAIYNTFINTWQQKDKAQKDKPLQRNYELARLGLSRYFARAIHLIDTYLRTYKDNLKEFHSSKSDEAGESWYKSIQDNINEIEALSAQIRGQVALNYQQQRKKT